MTLKFTIDISIFTRRGIMTKTSFPQKNITWKRKVSLSCSGYLYGIKNMKKNDRSEKDKKLSPLLLFQLPAFSLPFPILLFVFACFSWFSSILSIWTDGLLEILPIQRSWIFQSFIFPQSIKCVLGLSGD